jgi:hypothetical protein
MAPTTHDPRAIRDPAAIEALASPVRQELVDTLFVLGGTATAAELADALGHHADGLYYHLRVLCEVGLIDEIAANQGRERTFRLTGDARAPLRLAYENGPRGNTGALMTYVSGLLKVAGKDFEQAVVAADTVVDGHRRELWASRNKGWLSLSDIEEVNALLERLCDLVSQTRSDERNTLMTLAFVLAPSMARAKRR